MLEKLVAKIADLERQAEQSAAHHNGIVGALLEMKKLYHEAVQLAPEVEKVAEIVAPAEASAIEAVIDAL
jgi:hypothetical protein